MTFDVAIVNLWSYEGSSVKSRGYFGPMRTFGLGDHAAARLHRSGRSCGAQHFPRAIFRYAGPSCHLACKFDVRFAAHIRQQLLKTPKGSDETARAK
ncbi:hypothetical protein SAMN05428995_11314 [Loktanella sp. DSM 29012]|uniref:hypothetical protein n=1 Tax=Loktanella sp. DSM 29012 TaxID=1881056 RepID=UPI0008D1DF55|nr:hypothetical protein [Loktanella sp. DSM 29012]SEQ87291.1 hypothetical protein SAMN05428995_11314 [Loktanella sp. DSM 29012]